MHHRDVLQVESPAFRSQPQADEAFAQRRIDLVVKNVGDVLRQAIHQPIGGLVFAKPGLPMLLLSIGWATAIAATIQVMPARPRSSAFMIDSPGCEIVRRRSVIAPCAFDFRHRIERIYRRMTTYSFSRDFASSRKNLRRDGKLQRH